MKASAAGVALLIVLVVAIAAPADASAPIGGAVVSRVIDGDTIALTNGERVRLVQIDSPELGSGECFSRRAAQAARALMPVGSFVHLQADPRLDAVDRYGRLLRYVFENGRNVNVELVRRGAATVWFYGGIKGIYAGSLLTAGRTARATRTGLWGACRAVWNPYEPATTDPKARANTTGSKRCDTSYPDVCIPPPPPDLDCGDISYRHFRVIGADPHHFDGDHDGFGCEH